MTHTMIWGIYVNEKSNKIYGQQKIGVFYQYSYYKSYKSTKIISKLYLEKLSECLLQCFSTSFFNFFLFFGASLSDESFVDKRNFWGNKTIILQSLSFLKLYHCMDGPFYATVRYIYICTFLSTYANHIYFSHNLDMFEW